MRVRELQRFLGTFDADMEVNLRVGDKVLEVISVDDDKGALLGVRGLEEAYAKLVSDSSKAEKLLAEAEELTRG